ncbi:isomerase [Arachidicoccus ginsenosidimutans]|uniref:YybH family protein n=1 Tax=Arachidicoccus sp. BS20 TaxID=1850526 RepID=UPI0007F10852|nr:nuclear transport factor 2 family protein [Arachidicoccus sp. BS20]ANI89704.1 isomerase [Arachidicoccus sp. BS20]
MIASIEEMIEQYVAAWNKQNFEDYKAAFAKCWAEDATYTDPNNALVKGVEGITELAATSLEKSPHRVFHVLTQPDYHHNVGRYTWKVDLPEGSKEGFDYFEFNEEHKLTRIVSFF